MSYPLNAQDSGQKPFWKAADPSVGLNHRIAAINKYRDPTTSADELLRVCRIFILPPLLIFSGVLGAASYYSFFSHNFGAEIALGAAVLLAFVIEFGKARMGLRTIQKPFLEGWGTVFGSAGHLIIWVGTLLFAVATFTMSVINSTQGGKLLSIKSGQERHAQAFSPATDAIDKQIAAAENRIAENSKNKWKGKVTVHAQRANNQEAKTITLLQAQRDKATTTQRADYERQRNITDQNTETSSNWVMAAGGWVEGLQVIVLFIIAAAQSVLAGKMAGKQQQPNGAIGFRQNGLATAESNERPTAEDSPSRRFIGFNRNTETGDVRSTLPVAEAFPNNPAGCEPAPPYSLLAGVNLPPLLPTVLPEGAVLTEDGKYLFKQEKQLFKQVRNAKQVVIGLEYQGPKMAVATTLSYSQVISRISSYKNNKWRSPENRERMLAVWEFAKSLFEIPETTQDFQPIYAQTGEGVQA